MEKDYKSKSIFLSTIDLEELRFHINEAKNHFDKFKHKDLYLFEEYLVLNFGKYVVRRYIECHKCQFSTKGDTPIRHPKNV